MSNDWWQRRLGGGAPAPRPTAPMPPTTPSQPQQQPSPYAPGQQLVTPDPPETDRKLTGVDDFRAVLESATTTKGGQAARLETNRCPLCDGGNYFSRTSGLGKPAAPHCWDCGYPLVQYGSPTGAGEAVQP